MQQVARSFALAFNYLPRIHRVMLGSLTIFTLAITVLRPYIYSPAVERPATGIFLLEKHSLPVLEPEASELLDQTIPDNDEDIPKDELDERMAGEAGVHEYIISTGDTLSSVLTQYGIDIADVTALARQHPALRNLKISQSLSWTLTAEGYLQCLTWNISRSETRTYERVNGSFKESIANITGEWRNTTLTGKLNGSFVTSARIAGLTDCDINSVIKALQWQLDFRKLRTGDQFSVLTSREVLNGQSIQSQLLGVRLRTGGKDYYAFRADDSKFYNRDAAGVARGFMRFPTIKQFRVSSNFNLRRCNPVTGRIAPHRGVDFAMPVGTPVLAVGDGEVIVSKRDGAAGNYVAIRHSRQYMTRYMHLKKLLVTQGQKVKRGDKIALSGNTGRSTGPHLHYEVWINQQAVNPLTAKLPRTEGLTGNDRTKYLAKVKQMLPQLHLH
ncbi:murein DD-endopeptidase MepM [Sodalis endosymbiont of Henestaris halophilus]|uniref:murein DD-endopeptidase MepM n=1 Tax=Sodalis endosymbiont of Henestaris halophilus TaxID=1929246 RepID=UPI000BBF7062|nr:murein DD-endopeptidase MepM [Sodalis endosymbiont of Henestaris halophilus]SNC58444.1 Murein DD-endopeptidase MepM [Sodalis endosymbiont of Henestaris halophilus]